MRLLVAAALITGVFVRIAILPIGVRPVDDSWRAWSYHAATRGPWNLYGPRGHTVRFGDIDAPVVYPPLALDELAIVGRVLPIDPGVVVALTTCASFAWFAAVLARECAVPDRVPLA